jgi:hypothetical protein
MLGQQIRQLWADVPGAIFLPAHRQFARSWLALRAGGSLACSTVEG